MNSVETDKGSSLWKDAWIKLSKNRLALVGLGLLVILIVTSLLTPLIAPYGYEAQNLDMGATAPSLQHWLGTDIFGRDMLTRIMYGGRVSLMVGFIATAVALVIGILWGATAGYPHHSKCNVTRSFLELFRPRYSASPELLGSANQLRSRNYGGIPLATHIPRLSAIFDAICT